MILSAIKASFKPYKQISLSMKVKRWRISQRRSKNILHVKYLSIRFQYGNDYKNIGKNFIVNAKDRQQLLKDIILRQAYLPIFHLLPEYLQL
jgi:hypothetical protein